MFEDIRIRKCKCTASQMSAHYSTKSIFSHASGSMAPGMICLLACQSTTSDQIEISNLWLDKCCPGEGFTKRAIVECPMCPVDVSKIVQHNCWFSLHKLAGCADINDQFDVHKSTDVGVFVLQQHLACITSLWQCVSLKLETADGKHTCHLQMAVKGVDQRNMKVGERCW